MSVEPAPIAERVEAFVSDEINANRKYENRAPLDESGVWTLHQLAAEIYAAGFEAGARVAEVRERGRRERKFDAATAASEAQA